MQTPEIYVSTDIETDGWGIGRNSMLSLGSAAFLSDKTLLGTFSANLELLPDAVADPHTMSWWETQAEAWKACRENCLAPEVVMRQYCDWLASLPGKLIFVGYPAVFDFGFVNYYLTRFVGMNPFGFAVIDIRSYAMGLLNSNFRNTVKRTYPQQWFENRPHTHIALDDAIEQGILFCNMLQANNERNQT